ncbi:hypothetical protein EJ02DRAFT_412596 [Clathrospora elynae]|uniref:BTB domain-containing protein n=1 Tax=Clathrospora elynae TaxID=706981 RepID=A0A6A5SC70_9PLEO|nr:hypothetical protein EJ02DRAFT_412596 [Clathrospora elynae]
MCLLTRLGQCPLIVYSSFASGNYSDLIVTCGSDTYNVHKMIVCSRCDFFARAMKFSVGKESQDGIIELPMDDPATVKLLMQYLYECEYDPILPPGSDLQVHAAPGKVKKDKKSAKIKCTGLAYQLMTHSRMYEIGDKYDVVGLKALSKEKFHHACQCHSARSERKLLFA